MYINAKYDDPVKIIDQNVSIKSRTFSWLFVTVKCFFRNMFVSSYLMFRITNRKRKTLKGERVTQVPGFNFQNIY